MANKKISDGVGKKIVEALKKQSEIEINPISENRNQEDDLITEDFDTQDIFQEESQGLTQEEYQDTEQEGDFLDNLPSDDELGKFAGSEKNAFAGDDSSIYIEETPVSTMKQSFMSPPRQTYASNDSFIKELDSFEIPSNISVLKKLIAQLPSGVTRHTGAQIIKQTMEALGISMKSVLQEAQQAQEGLSNSAKECHATIQEYKKQIVSLEKQAQSNQRQYAALNELISLFIQTGV